GTVLLDEFAVRINRSAPAEVCDHVPVDCGAVRAARLRVRLPERQVHRPADLLVIQDAPDGAPDPVVRADAELPEETGAPVGVKLRLEQVVTGSGPGAHGLPVFEAHLDVLHFHAADGGGNVKRDRAVRGVLDRPGEHFTARHVAASG